SVAGPPPRIAKTFSSQKKAAMPTDTHPVSPAAAAQEAVRRDRRALFSVPITLRHLMTGDVRTAHGITLDLSETGMGALVEGGLHVGDTVAVEFTLSDRALNATAVVRHSSSVRSGLEFLGLTVEEHLRIAAIVGHC
ncbi:MAG: PilZ domain-containing protein, partial [Candidatus Sulfotelmatobacter sp.]